MKAQIELSSISMSKNDQNMNKVDKYDVEASIDEVENGENLSIFKYGFTALSNPKNVRLAIEGIARISGDSTERDEILSKDENDIPKILTMIYQELFPTFFLLSKSLNVSCPPHQIGEMGESLPQEAEMNEEGEKSEIESELSQEDVTPENDLQEQVAESNSEPEIQENSQEELEKPDMAQPTV